MVRITLAFALTMFVACKEKNPLFCNGNPDDPRCTTDGPIVACSTDDECTPQVCDVAGTQTCVECTADKAAACTGTSPICGDDLACRGCSTHTECPDSNACLPDGSCADSDDVAYVASTGSGTACSQAMPCGLLATAISANTPYVKFATGLVKDTNTTVIDGKTVTILADSGAKLDKDGDGVILEIRSAGANVTIRDLEVTGQTGINDDAISIVPNGGSPTVVLTRVKLASNQGGGISSTGGSLTVSQSTLSGNQGGGISSSGGSLTVSQSTLSGNQGGGIVMTNDGVVIVTNNFIHHNGNTTTASAGGLSLKPMGASRVEFNTIIDNQANLGAASAGGVFCDAGGFIATNNIIFRNTGGALGNVQTFGNCTYGTSLNTSGTSAIDNTPNFANPNNEPFDYHLTATTPLSLRDAATCGAVNVDFDGDARPATACDLGADELVP